MYEQGVTNQASKEFEPIWQVVRDLTEAAPDLFVSYTAAGNDINTRGRATRGAAHALLAGVFMAGHLRKRGSFSRQRTVLLPPGDSMGRQCR